VRAEVLLNQKKHRRTSRKQVKNQNQLRSFRAVPSAFAQPTTSHVNLIFVGPECVPRQSKQNFEQDVLGDKYRD
jgi:hypothetical protein